MSWNWLHEPARSLEPRDGVLYAGDVWYGNSISAEVLEPCTRVRACVCVHNHVHVHDCVRARLRVCVCTTVCVCVHECVCVHKRVHNRVCECVRAQVVCVCTSACTQSVQEPANEVHWPCCTADQMPVLWVGKPQASAPPVPGLLTAPGCPCLAWKHLGARAPSLGSLPAAMTK